MAQFDVLEEQRMRFVRVALNDETVRTEAGSLAYLRGPITMKARIPGPGAYIRASLSDEKVVRPTFTGSGELILASSLGGFHVFEVADEHWIISAGAYWASEGSVELGVHREKALVSFWAGTGLIDFKTKLGGRGKAVLNSPGPVEEIEIPEGEEVRVEGPLVIGRTASVDYSIRRPTRSRIGSHLSGLPSQHVYRGPGKVLMCSTPYWNSYLLGRMTN